MTVATKVRISDDSAKEMLVFLCIVLTYAYLCGRL